MAATDASEADGPQAADGPDAQVRRWIEANIGPVVRFERQARWRPGWFVDAEKDGKQLALYVRGNREGEAGRGAMPVHQEAAILQLLEEHGVRVPHIHGLLDEPCAAVMDRLDGRANLATAADDAERSSVLAEYMDMLAAVHGIDPATVVGLGLPMPETPEAIALAYFDTFVARYRSGKRQPEPLIEFAIGWLRRNVPRGRGTAHFLLGDPGQFMFAEGRITGLLDVELAHLGEPSHDLAALRLRNIPEPLGDLAAGFRRYAATSGQPLDVDAIEFHTAKFALCVPLSLTGAIHAGPPLPEIIQYLEWFLQYQLSAIEVIATLAGVELVEPELPHAIDPPYAAIVASLPETIDALAAEPGIDRFRRERTAAVARLCHRIARYGMPSAAADIVEQAQLVGKDAADRGTADALLEAFILSAGPEHDPALIALLFRRVMRQMLLIEPLLNRTGRIERLTPVASLLA